MTTPWLFIPPLCLPISEASPSICWAFDESQVEHGAPIYSAGKGHLESLSLNGTLEELGSSGGSPSTSVSSLTMKPLLSKELADASVS